MLTTCLACHRPFPANETLEHFPVGHRIAYDPERGRLWAVCPSCARWTLAPFDARWEALEELERTARDRARLLAETDNIGLLTVDDIDVIRVGHADLREESWWRFGKEFAVRRKKAKRQVLKGKIVNAAATAVILGIPFWGHTDADRWIDRARKKEFGRKVGKSSLSRCDRCGYELGKFRFEDYGRLGIRTHPERPFALALECPRCDADQLLTGVPAEHVLRRTLAYNNFAGGTEATVKEAVGLVEAYDDTDQLLRRVAEQRIRLSRMTEKGAFALEIALNADVERRMLEMELAELEARWRQEERIAAIADQL